MIKTLNLTANAETCVADLGGDRCRIQNRTAGTLYVSGSPNIAPCTDGVMSIPAGRGDYYSYSMKSDTLYLLSAAGGDIEISGENYYRPFDNAAVTGGVAVGNPVVMDGLQGGVPFSEIVVSGKNLIPYPYYDTTKIVNGITFTDNGDGSITAEGTATGNAFFTFFAANKSLYQPGEKFTISGLPAERNGYSVYIAYRNAQNTSLSDTTIDSDSLTFTMKNVDGAVSIGLVIRIFTGSTVNFTCRPQLELGDTPTAYELPIMGRELTINATGTEIVVTPDSNPYTVPDDIRQQDGMNILTVSAGELTVSYSKTDPALSRIYKTIDSLATAIVAMGAEN